MEGAFIFFYFYLQPIIIQCEFITCNMSFKMQYPNRLKENLQYMY